MVVKSELGHAVIFPRHLPAHADALEQRIALECIFI
jgi:hypothetical protein